MKTQTFMALGLAAALAVPALAAAPGQGPVDPELRQARQAFHAAEVVQTLGLSKDQKQQIKKLVEQARALRDTQQKDPQVVKARDRLKTLLAQATKEVHASGQVSPETQQNLAAVQGELGGIRKVHRQRMFEVLQQIHAALSPEQLQKLQSLRGGPGMGPGMHRGRGMGRGMGPGAGMGPGRGMGPGAGMGPGRGWRHHGAGMGPGGGRQAMRLLLSDAFLAELSR